MNKITQATILFGAFSAMALSNAVVPVLNEITSDSILQGAVYSAYFLGAFIMVFPAGLLSDKLRRKPLIKIGLFGTFLASVLLWVSYPDPLLGTIFRLLEGLFTGVFVSAALAFMNSQKEHKKLAGEMVALMNVGMVAGLVITGWLAVYHSYAGVLLFGILTGISAVMSLYFQDSDNFTPETTPASEIRDIFTTHTYLWLALFIFCGTTGVVTSLYPALSGFSADLNGVVTALMSIATAVSVYIVSRFSFGESLTVIRGCGVLLAISVPIVMLSPIGMILVGAVFGMITVAVLNYIAETKKPQGTMNGVFYLMQYGGMAVLPFFAGVLLGFGTGYLVVFLIVAAVNLFAGLAIVRCPCYVK